MKAVGENHGRRACKVIQQIKSCVSNHKVLAVAIEKMILAFCCLFGSQTTEKEITTDVRVGYPEGDMIEAFDKRIAGLPLGLSLHELHPHAQGRCRMQERKSHALEIGAPENTDPILFQSGRGLIDVGYLDGQMMNALSVFFQKVHDKTAVSQWPHKFKFILRAQGKHQIGMNPIRWIGEFHDEIQLKNIPVKVSRPFDVIHHKGDMVDMLV